MSVLLIVIALVVACSNGFARVLAGVRYPGGAVGGLLVAGMVTVLSRRLRLVTNGVLQVAHTAYLA